MKLFGDTTNPYETLSTFRCVIKKSQFVFNKRNGYLIPNQDTQMMAEAIIDIMKDDSKYVDFGEESRRIVLKEFDPDNIVNECISTFNRNK